MKLWMLKAGLIPVLPQVLSVWLRLYSLMRRLLYLYQFLLTGEYGLKDVALSLPSVVGKDGVEKRLALPLPEDELETFIQELWCIKEVLRASNLNLIYTDFIKSDLI